jgi:predicted house-cleaning noncanonical NTP pyrophosphatase (MazG superfamily)
MPHYNKLVRDRIPDICRSNGDTPHFRVLEDESDYTDALTAKLVEEANEVRKTPSIEELADTYEVLLAIAKVLGHSAEDIERARAAKAEERGGFENRIYLEYTD